MTHQQNPTPRSSGLHLKIVVLVLSVLLVIASIQFVRDKGPIERALDEIVEQLGGISEIEAAHYREVGQVSDVSALVNVERRHAGEIDTKAEGIFKRLAWIESCAEEGGTRRMPWLSELLGRLKEEEQAHSRTMGAVKEVEAAQREETRHQQAMEGLFKDLMGQLEKALQEAKENKTAGAACK